MGTRLGLRLAAIASLLAINGCGSGGGSGSASNTPGEEPPFGLETRSTVTTLAFPSSNPQPSGLTAVQAFPSLTFSRPIFLTAPPDGTDRICVVEQGGRVLIFPNSPATTTTRVFLDLRGQIVSGGEEGLLGLAFDPGYARNGRFYVYHSVGSPRRTVVARYQVSASDRDAADPQSRRVLLEVAQPYSNHKGGMMAFGPDGLLYIALGDGGDAGDPHNHGQDLGTLLGSILRIRPEDGGSYSVPSDNPFVGQAGARGEIWAYGLRNPWRFSFDREEGDLWVADVGQGDWEEVSVAAAGDNLGWKVYEGNHAYRNPGGLPPSAFKAPVIEYSHSQGNAVVGGYVYRGSLLQSLRGVYLYGDNGSGRVWALVPAADLSVVSNRQVSTVSGLSSFGEDEAGELYAVSLGGRVYRFQETDPAPAPFPTLLSRTGIFRDLARLEPQPGLIEFAINHEHWVDGAIMRRWIALPGREEIDFDPTGPWTFPERTVLVKHFEIELRPGDPSSVSRLETRVLIHEEAGWAGYTYRWNDAGTDATLLADAETESLTIETPSGPRAQVWHYPSRNDCLRCHTAAAGMVLGVRARQLNRDFPYPRAADNQLRSWNHIGLFTTDIGPADALEAIVSIEDDAESLESRARAYLEVNCAHCHLPGGPVPGDMDLRLDTLPAAMALLDRRPTSGDLGLPDAYRVKVGVKESSVLWERLRRTDNQRMPPLATGVPDELAVEVLGGWIDALNP